MENKTYTAQEMRDMAENITRVDVMDGLTCREHCYPVEKEVKSMLRYAAEIQERCDNVAKGKRRNCDRPECATTKAAQEVWRKEDGGKTAYYEWLLATSTKGEAK